MNTEVHETTKATPYELVFGQRPRTSLFPSEHGPNIVTEEQLEEDGLDTSTPPPSSDGMNDAEFPRPPTPPPRGQPQQTGTESPTPPTPPSRGQPPQTGTESPTPPTPPPRGQPPQSGTESTTPPTPPPRDRLLATTEKHHCKTGLVSRCWSQTHDKH